jgi:hypothetical protein
VSDLLNDLPRECADLIAVWRYRGLTDATIVAELEKVAEREGGLPRVRDFLSRWDADHGGRRRGVEWIVAAMQPQVVSADEIILLRLTVTVLERLAARRAHVAEKQRATSDAIEAELAAQNAEPVVVSLSARGAAVSAGMATPVGVAGASKATPADVREFVDSYIANNPNPTQSGAEAAWKAAGWGTQHRQHLRNHFNKGMGDKKTTVGRPPRNSQKK